MAINALIIKDLFDKNPDREFYIEESFPLEWTYPYLEPHGLIMKINRQPLPELSETTVDADRKYWRNLANGMIGDWLTEEQPCKPSRNSPTRFMCAKTSTDSPAIRPMFKTRVRGRNYQSCAIPSPSFMRGGAARCRI